MNNLKGSKTEKNLIDAFSGESMARNKYGFYAAAARRDGFEQIAAIFEETAANEARHAMLWFKFLHGGEIPETGENLRDASHGEHFEWSDMYARMAREAKEEGFDRIAYLFSLVGAIEKEHEERFLKLLSKVGDGTVFTSEGDAIWKCRVCGHIVIGKTPPSACPVCGHPRAFFEIKAENY